MTDIQHENGGDGKASNRPYSDEDRRRELHEAVRDVDEPDRGPVTPEDVETLRDAELTELAEIAEEYV